MPLETSVMPDGSEVDLAGACRVSYRGRIITHIVPL